MAWLKIDGHSAVFDTDERINALHEVINARLLIHGDVFLHIKFGTIYGPEFHITGGSRITHPERVNDARDDKLYNLLGSDGELRSPQIAFDFATKEFEVWGASQMW